MRFNYAAFESCEGSYFDSLITSSIVAIFFITICERGSYVYFKRLTPYLLQKLTISFFYRNF
jgi:hypothetical protein